MYKLWDGGLENVLKGKVDNIFRIFFNVVHCIYDISFLDKKLYASGTLIQSFLLFLFIFSWVILGLAFQ